MCGGHCQGIRSRIPTYPLRGCLEPEPVGLCLTMLWPHLPPPKKLWKLWGVPGSPRPLYLCPSSSLFRGR